MMGRGNLPLTPPFLLVHGTKLLLNDRIGTALLSFFI